MTHPPIISLDNIHLRRGGKDILRGVTWQIAPGEHWALIGANGCGKTTLLKVIAGYEWPTEGSVSVMGQRYGECNIPELRRHIGWVSNALTDRVPPGDTAEEVVASGLESSFGLFREFSMPEHDLARAALASLGVESVAGRPWGVMSQGERQRALIARALIARPSLLILDEPCAGLDPVARANFLRDLGRIAAPPDPAYQSITNSTAPTILLVTHHIEEIKPWITRVLLMCDGQTLAAGPADAVLTPAHLSAAFGQPCTVEHRNGRYLLIP